MLLLEGPAQTFNYMVLGYAVILGLMAILIASLIVRYRRLRQELHMLEDLASRGKS